MINEMRLRTSFHSAKLICTASCFRLFELLIKHIQHTYVCFGDIHPILKDDMLDLKMKPKQSFYSNIIISRAKLHVQ